MRIYIIALTLVLGSMAIFQPGEAPPAEEFISDDDIFADDELEIYELPTSTASPDTEQAGTQPQKCGMRQPQATVIFKSSHLSVKARYAEFNWAVPIFEVLWNGSENYTSVGSLIHPQVVLTVAHYYNRKRNLKIRAGNWDITNRTNEFKKYQSIYVSNVEIHPNFKPDTLKNDVALLFLASPVTPAVNIGFACLPPTYSVTTPGTECVTTGWGVEWYGSTQIADIMKMVTVPMVSDSDCQEILRKIVGQAFNLHNSWLCAGGKADQDACIGDGGGPLVCPYKDSKNQYYQAGIVSWGQRCGLEGVPGIYTDVAEVRQWIDDQMLAKGFGTDTYTA